MQYEQRMTLNPLIDPAHSVGDPPFCAAGTFILMQMRGAFTSVTPAPLLHAELSNTPYCRLKFDFLTNELSVLMVKMFKSSCRFICFME